MFNELMIFFFGSTLKRLSKKKFSALDKTPLKVRLNYLGTKLANTLKGPRSWVVFLPITIFLCLLSTFDWGFITIFFFKNGEVDSYLQKWLGYFIGLFGAVIAVAIFILSGIQTKNQAEEQLSIIFRESFLFPLIYTSLTVIGLMVFISFRPTFLTELYVIRLTVLGLYLFLFELILIAILFRRAFQFIDPSFLVKKYYDDLKSTLFNELKNDFISKLSSIVLKEEFSKLQLEPNYLYLQQTNYSELRIELKEKMIIKDFLIEDLKKWFYKAPGDIKGTYYLPFYLNQYLAEKSPIFWIKDHSLLNYLKGKNLSKVFVLSRIKTAQSEVEKLKLKMKNRLFVSIQNNNLESFYTILDMYNFILIQFAEMYSNFSVFESGVELSSSHVFSPKYSWNILYNLDADIRNAFLFTIDLKNREANKELIDFVFDVYVLAIRKKNLTLIHLFKYSPIQFLRLSYKKEDYDISASIYFFMRLKEIIALQATIECEKSEERNKEKVFAIIIILFNEFVNIIKYLLTNENNSALENAWTEFSQCASLFETFQEKAFAVFPYSVDRYPTNYYYGNIFALWAWSILLFKNNKISSESFNQIDKLIAIQNIDLNLIFEYYLLESDRKYFWNDWEIEELKPMKGYWKLSTEDWLLYALVLFILKYQQIYAFTFENYSKRTDWYDQSIKTITNDILDHYDSKWKVFFDNQNILVIKETINNFTNKLNEYKSQYEYQKTQEVIKKHLSENTVNKFIVENYNRWFKSGPIYKLFDRYGNLQIVEQSEQLPKCSHIYNLFDGKKWFAYEDEYYIHVATEFGFNHNKYEKVKFIRGIIRNRDDQNRLFPKFETCVETLITELRQKEVEPNLIICSRTKVLHDREFRSLAKFKRAPLIGYTNDPANMDLYDGIPIYYIEDKEMPYVIVSKFEKAFTMKLRRPQDNIESIFQLQVHEFTPQEAEELVVQDNSTWTKDNDGNPIPGEKALEKILSSVKIEVFTEFEFIIKDNNIYRVGNVREENSEDEVLEGSNP